MGSGEWFGKKLCVMICEERNSRLLVVAWFFFHSVEWQVDVWDMWHFWARLGVLSSGVCSCFDEFLFRRSRSVIFMVPWPVQQQQERLENKSWSNNCWILSCVCQVSKDRPISSQVKTKTISTQPHDIKKINAHLFPYLFLILCYLYLSSTFFSLFTLNIFHLITFHLVDPRV